MPIPDYDGKTFVAFADISGFKEMMKHDDKAVKALDRFYTSGYDVLFDHPEVHGLFMSDSAVLFVNSDGAPQEQLPHLLAVIEQLNRRVLEHDIILTTSIAYGRFCYHQRIEFAGIEKNPVYGNAYVAAWLDNEKGQPQIQPGQCRIVKRGLEDFKVDTFPRLTDENNHFHFYWMVKNSRVIPVFNELYADTYQQKYRGMLEAMKAAVNNRLDTAIMP